MANPQIFWNWQNLPSNADEVTPLCSEKVGDQEVALFYNHTQKCVVFEHDGAYGVLVKGG